MTEASLTSDGHASEWFAKLILLTAEAYGTKLTEARVRIYAAELRDLPRDKVETAFATCRRDSSFFPALAEVRKAALGSPDDRALIAWSSLERAAQAFGSWTSWQCDDAWTANAMLQTFGSWGAFCALEAGSPEMLTKRQSFLATYRDVRRQMAYPNLPVRIRGLCENSGGQYRRLPAIWTGRLTLDGRVEHERERPALPCADPVRRLTTATDDEDNNDGKENEEYGAARDGRPNDR